MILHLVRGRADLVVIVLRAVASDANSSGEISLAFSRISRSSRSDLSRDASCRASSLNALLSTGVSVGVLELWVGLNGTTLGGVSTG